jgi:hypothetical protein
MPPWGIVRRPGRHRIVGQERDVFLDSTWFRWLVFERVGRFHEERRTLLRLARDGDPFAARILWLRWKCKWVTEETDDTRHR